MLTIAHRFALCVLAVLVLLALLVLAAPAGAAEVAREGRTSLDVRDDPTGICLRVMQGASGGGTCTRAPLRERRSAIESYVSGKRVLVGGAVPASVARAEAELSDGRRVATDTVAGERYRGRYAGRLRFFVLALPAVDPGDLAVGGLMAVRFYNAEGALVGVAGSPRLGARTGTRRVLLRERAGRRSIAIVAQALRRIVPTPLQLDRPERLTCLESTLTSRFGAESSSTVCRDDSPYRPRLLVLPEQGCDGLRTIIFGFAGDAVTAVRLRLGSGRVREVRTRTLPLAEGGFARYVATAIPRGEAVRSVAAVGASAAYDLRQPPSGLPCFGDSGSSFFGLAAEIGRDDDPARPPGEEQVAAESDGHRLLVRDGEADRVCAGIDRLRADGDDCLLPPANAEDAVGLVREGMVAAVLPAEVAAVRLPDGRVVPTVEGAYSGPYAGRIRFLLARSTARLTDRFRALDAAGRVIGPLAIFDLGELDPKPSSHRAALARGRGWRLTAARTDFGACTFLTLRGEEPECAIGLSRSDSAMAAVGCTPRVAVLTGTLSRRGHAVRVELRGGRTLRARIVRVPRRVGGARVWVREVPRGARVVALRLGDRRDRFPLLSAADQCGYRVYAPGFGEAEAELGFGVGP